jgi:KAP family P-loop domain
VVETLEAVNFLVTAGPCFVILGIAPEQVMRCVGLGFKDIAAEMAAANAHTADEGRAWRREFAKNYLEKLINVEVPVPTLTSEDARKIVATAGEDKQPRRLGKHGSGPWMAACFALLFVSALYVGAHVDDWLQMPSAPEMADSSGTLASTGSRSTRGGETTSAGDGSTGQPSERANRVYFREGKHAAIPWWSWQMPLAGFIALGGAVLLVHALRREDPVVRDSKDFSDALDIWVPVVLTRTRSPRAVKRFVNRVRYYAMCETPPEPTPTWKERLSALFGPEPSSSPATQTASLPETLLVALGAIKEWRPEMLTTADALDVQMTLDDHPPDKTVSSAVQRHAEAFGGFSPAAPQVERFIAVAAGVTVR